MLGPLEVRTDGGEPLAVSGTRLRQLLIALALHPRRVVTAGYLAAAVWGDEPPVEPGNAIQSLVSRLRRALPGIEVANRANGYLLDIDPDAVDVRRFERLVAAGRSASPTAPAQAAATLRTALALWRGPALADAAEAEFARAAIARLDELRLAAQQERIDAELRCDTAPAAGWGGLVAELEGLVADHPLREPLVKLLIRALHASGDRGRALAVYERARTRLAEELGVEPGADLAAEHLRILRAAGPPEADLPGNAAPEAGPPGVAETPPGTTAGAADPVGPTNLRAEISSFVGRESDLAGVEALLSSARLATLTGPGGAGKTRLAAHAARLRVGTMPDGAWMVELAPIADPTDVVPAVLAALGVRDRALARPGGAAGTEPIADLTQRLVAALAHREALLVLDNCEHLIGTTARLADTILGACPGIRILATSREPLGVTGEALWPVEPLALPVLATSSPGELSRYPAVRLLVERAALVRPGFAVTADNADAVVRICRALDGMPLAIELAAARLRAMTPEQLAARLDDRFAVLTGGSRTALPRHQTLRAVVDWSWDLLDEAERALLRRLSVFSGGATLPAVEGVCAGDGLPAERVLDALAGLVDKSLVGIRDDAPEPRYHLLETIRAYGQMKLDEAGEREWLRSAHAAYFLDFAKGKRFDLVGAGQLDALARISADHDNFNAALRGAVAAGDAGTAVSLAASLAWYWWLRGHRAEATELCAAALDAAKATGEPDDQAGREELATAYTMGAMLAIDGTHDVSRALPWFEAAADLVRGIPDPELPVLRLVEPLYVTFLSFMSGPLGSVTEVRLPVDDPDPWIRGISLVMRAHVLLNFGRLHAEAEVDFHRALAIFRSLGERWASSFTLTSLAMLAGWRGDLSTAIAHNGEAVRDIVELGAPEDEVELRVKQLQLLWADGQHSRAHAELAQADRVAQRLGVPHVRGRMAHVASDVARWQGDLALAAEFADRAEDLLPDHGVAPQLQSMVATSRGFLESARGDADAARQHHRRAVELAVSSYDAPVVAQALVGLAELALDEGDARLAATVMGAGTGVRGRPDLSFVDGVRVAARAEAALGTDAFQHAYERGLSSTGTQIGELVGVSIPENAALTNRA